MRREEGEGLGIKSPFSPGDGYHDSSHLSPEGHVPNV